MSATSFVAEPGRQEIVITRAYDAPRARVFEVLTDPAMQPRWWGPRDPAITVIAMDVRPGGLWRFVGRDAGGNEYGFHGYYHLVEPPSRLVQTFEYEGTPGHVSLETFTLEDLDGRTLLTDQTVYQSVADRDAMTEADMEMSAKETMDRLAELVEGVIGHA